MRMHKGEKSVLLCLVEAVYLVHEEDGAFAETTVFFRLFHDLFYLFYAARDSRKVYEIRLGAIGDYAREGSFADSRRTPEYHGAYLVALDETAEHLTLAEEVLLTAVFLQILRAQSRRQRQTDLIFKKSWLFVYHTLHLGRAVRPATTLIIVSRPSNVNVPARAERAADTRSPVASMG